MLKFLEDLLDKTNNRNVNWEYSKELTAWKLSKPMKLSSTLNPEHTVEVDVILHFSPDTYIELTPVGQDNIQNNMKTRHKIGAGWQTKMGMEVLEIFNAVQLLNIESELFKSNEEQNAE